MSLLPIDNGNGGGLFGGDMMPLLLLGAGLMQGAQRSPTPVNPWAQGMQGLAQGIALGNQQSQKQREYELQKQLKDLQELKIRGELADSDFQRKKAGEFEGLLKNYYTGGGSPPTGTSAVPSSAPAPDLLKTGGPMVDTVMSSLNLPRVGAAGVVGGLYQESQFNPTATHDNGTGYGMGGWRLDRRDKLMQFAQAQGKEPSDPNVQIAFLASEMKGGDMGAQRAFAMLQQAKTPEDATTAMMHYFRPAGYTPANPQAGRGYQNRVQYTTQLAGGMPGQGVPQGDSVQPPADGSGNPRPPQSAANVPNVVMPAQQPGGPRIDPMLLAPYVGNKFVGPQAKELIGIGDRERDFGLKSSEFDYRKKNDAETAAESKRRWEYEQKFAKDKEDFARNHNGEWVRDDKGERFVPRSQMGPDVRRQDKAPEPATEVGDYRVLATADPGSREYAAAYNRLGNTMIDVGNGQKRPPNMQAFAAPTFKEPNAAPEAPPGPNATPKEMQDLRTARGEAQTIIAALEDYRREFTKDKGVRSVMGFSTPANTSYNIAALMAKGEALFNLGVLNGPDLEIIRRTLPDPSTMTGTGTKPKEMNIAVDKVISLINSRIAAKEAQLGITPQSGGGAQSAAPAAPQNGSNGTTRSLPRIDLNGRPL